MFPRILRTGWPGDVAAAAAGAALPLAFAPFNYFPVAVVAPAVLFALWLEVSRGRAFWRGWLFGLGMFGTGITWIFISVHHYGHVPLALALFLTALLVAFLALFPALYGYWCNRFIDGLRVRAARLLLVLPAGWVLAEWVRGWFLTGFPWLNLGYSQIDSPLVGYAPVAGVYGVSLMVALSAGLLVLLLTDRGWMARSGWLASLAVVWLAGFMLSQIEWTAPDGVPLKIAMIQGNISQDVKWHPDQRQPTIDMYRDLTRQQWGADLVIWPESAMPAFYDELEFMFDEFSEELRAEGTDLLAGVLYMDLASGHYYNSMISAGSTKGFYHKRHLVPFTESLPFKYLLGGLVAFMDVPMSDFSAGHSGQPLLEAAGHKIGISICFEDAFGEEVIETLPEAGLLVNVSNDGWFGRSIGPYQHLQIARMRSAETARPMLRATNTGVTAIIDRKGKLVDTAPQFETYVLSGTVQPQRGTTPYISAGNVPVVILSMALLLIAWRLRRL
ncbi:MAG: apolipoprotein N-acyltransferase [Gammaproteobacteria bacterium]|nr:MAG: apolipoprotein N-acyltransferase [Gammaproteobacteria bacterium]TND06299.1 MAG: apolipoprotein N-acyltransferase [Gammaproteobacteria bacterium]